jgi:hypothetical protein
MIDWVNIVLRTLMCLAFLVLVLRPMMLALVRREPDHEALEELANSAVNSAFKAWRQNADTPAYYNNPELALLALSHPDVLTVAEKPAPQEAPPVEPVDTATAVSADKTPVAQAADTGAPAGESATTPVEGGSAGAGEAPTSAEASVPVEEDVDPDEQLQQMRDRIKKEQKKAKPTIPAELLNNANSYEDKLMVVRMIVDQERDRVAVTLKRMIQVE